MATRPRILVGIPVFNEAAYINSVLSQVTRYANDVLIVDDGSTDLTPALLAGHPVEVIRHSENRGYGRSLQDMFRWAAVDDFDWLITMDCDEQHEPAAIPRFVDAIEEDNWDVISGSRYLQTDVNGDLPPADRRTINRALTGDLNAALGTNITDAFCGFKAYRVSSLADMAFDVDGYEFPIQFWVQAAAHGLRLREIPVRLLYVDLSRTFGGPLDDADVRLAHYREVYCRELGKHLPTARDRVPC